jgi:steroid delta-isomerase-like uncharacterized protein
MDAMKPEQNKEKERLLVEEVLNKGNLSVLDDLLSPNFVYHGIDWKEVKGIDAYKQMIKGLRTVYPDFHATIEDIIAEGSIVATRYTCRFTFTGQVEGFTPTGKNAVMTGVIFERFEDGKMTEIWDFYDQMDVKRQLGIESMGSSS